MPISDEIIELAPVKKTKSKLIIMFAIMGVLLALAITFLILYFLKEGKVDDLSSVTGVEVAQSSELFSTEENGKLTASVGNEYTVYVNVGVKGDANPDVTWIVEPAKDAVTIIDSGLVADMESKNADGDPVDLPAATGRYYCKFVPNEKYAGQDIKLTARSQLDAAMSATIEFTIVRQGTEYINITTYRRGSSGAFLKVENDSLALPMFEQNSDLFYVNFEQLGACNASLPQDSPQKYSKITISETDGVKSNSVSVSASNDVVEIVNTNPERFTFRLKKAGESDITITANVSNDYGRKDVTATLHVKSTSSAELRYIEKIYFNPTPVDAQFFEDNWTKPIPKLATSDTKYTENPYFTLPYSVGTYADILSHIVITPYTVQYDKDKKELRTDWYKLIDIKSSDSNICTVTVSNGIYGLVCSKALARSNQCKLTISDKSEHSIGATRDVALSVVAPVNDLSAELVTGTGTGKKTYDQKQMAAGIDGARGKEYDLTVTYAVNAPSLEEDAIKTLVGDGLISSDYAIELSDPKFMTVYLGDTKLDLSKPLKFSDKTLAVSKTKDGKLIATATFALAINTKDVSENEYTLRFTKIGYSINKNDPDINVDIKFNVSVNATKAEFVDAATAKNLITNNGARAGSFEKITDRQARIYVQNQGNDVNFKSRVFDIANLIKNDLDDNTKINAVGKAKNTKNPFKRATGDYSELTFNGGVPDNALQAQATIEMEIIAKGTDESLGIFTFDIYVVDMITGISCEQTTEIKTYQKKSGSSAFLSFPRDAVYASYMHSGTDTEAYTSVIDLAIEYGSAGSRLYARRDKSDANKMIYTFEDDEDATPLFTYDGATISLVYDIFVKGFDTANHLDDFTFVYSIPETSTSTGANYDQPKVSRSRKYEFVRVADDIMLYSDAARQKPITLNKNVGTHGTFIYEGNQLTQNCEIYASAIIERDDGEADIVIGSSNNNANYEGLHSDVWFTIPAAIKSGLTDSTALNETNYSYIKFTTPEVVGTQQTFDGGTAKYANSESNGYALRFDISNKQRPVDEAYIGIYEDELCTTPLNEIRFGAFNPSPANPYVREFYIKFRYVAPGEKGTYNNYEPLNLNLPAYVEYKLKDGNYNTVSTGGYQIRPVDATDVDDEETDYVQKVTLHLIADKAGNKNGTVMSDEILLYSSREYNNLDVVRTKAVRKAITTVDTGVKQIDYNVYDKAGTKYDPYDTKTSSAAVDLEFKLANDADIYSRKVTFEPVGLAEDDYSAITYVRSNLVLVYGTYTETAGVINFTPAASDTAVAGLKYEASNDWFKIGVNGAALTNMSDVKVAVAMYDFASGGLVTDAGGNVQYDDADAVFYLKFNVSVETDLYAARITDTLSFVSDGSNGHHSLPLHFVYNNGKTNIQPTADMISKVSVYAAEKVSGAYSKITGDVDAVKVVVREELDGTFTLLVSKTIHTGLVDGNQRYYLIVTYDGRVISGTDEYPVVISSSEYGIRLRDSAVELGSEGSLSGNTANIVVADSTQKFKLGAMVYNVGSNAEEMGAVISYTFYDSSARTGAASAVITHNADKTFSITAPDASGSGILYFRASYTYGETGHEKTVNLDIDINYTVTINDVSLIGLDDVLDNGVITLYYKNESNYTELDLTGHIFASTAFDTNSDKYAPASIASGATVAAISAPALSITGKKLHPTAASLNAQRIKLSATYGAVTKEKEYTVSIVTIAAPTLPATLDGKAVHAELNAVTGNTIDVEPVSVQNYGGLVPTVTYVPADSIVKSTAYAGTHKTKLELDRTATYSASDYTGAHDVSVIVTYAKAASANANVVGALTATATYKVGLTWSGYTPAFKLVKQNGTTFSDVGETDTYDSTATYYIQLITDSSSWYDYDEWTFSVQSLNSGVASVASSFDDTTSPGKYLAAVSNMGNGFGEVRFRVTATAFAQSSAKEETYNIIHGGSATATVGVSSDGGTNYTGYSDGDTVNVDYDASTPARKIRYYINTASVGATVSASDIRVVYSGNVTPDLETGTNVVKIYTDGTDKFYALFTADKNAPSVFNVQGVIVAGGRTFYLTSFALDLDATAPDYNITLLKSANEATGLGADELLPDMTATFGVSLKTANAAFKGATGVSYEVISGSEYVKNFANGVLEFKKNILTDARVIVRATVVVTTGAYKGTTLTYEKAITVKGIPLPTTTWNTTGVELAANASNIDIHPYLTVGDRVTVAGKQYLFSKTIIYNYSATSLVNNTDYSTNNNKVTIRNTAAAKAGGAIDVAVTVQYSIDGLIDSHIVAAIGAFRITVKPEAVAVAGVKVSGKKGIKYDITAAAKPISVTGASHVDQVLDTDGYTVSYALSSSDSNIIINGSTIEFVDNVLEDPNKTVPLIATVRLTSGAYAGTSMTVATSIEVLGHPAAPVSIAWDNSNKKYGTLLVADVITNLGIGTPGSVSVALRPDCNALGAFVNIDLTHALAPVISFANDINTVTDSSVTDTVDVTFAITAIISGQEHYIEVTARVAPIVISVAVKVDEAERTPDSIIELAGGAAAVIAIEETNGIPVSNVKVEGLGDYLSCSISGANMLIVASDVPSQTSVSVSFTATVNGKNTEFTLVFKISPRAAEGAFTVTNKTVTVNKAEEKPVFVTTWTSSAGNTYKTGESITISLANMSEKLVNVYFDGLVTGGGTQSKDYTITWEGTTGFWGNKNEYPTRTLELPKNGNSYYSYDSFSLSFKFKSKSNLSFDVKYKSSDGSSTVNTEAVYNVTFSNSIPVTYVTGSPDVVIDRTSDTFTYNGRYTSTPRPTREGYSFDGWFTDVTLTNQVTSTTTVATGYSHNLYAGWSTASYDITVHADGGNGHDSIPSDYTVNTPTIDLPGAAVMTKTNYTFVAWHMGAVGGTVVTQIVKGTTGNIDLYAEWRPNSYTVTVYPNGGSGHGSIPATYNVETPTITLPTAADMTKTGYTFVAWHQGSASGTEVTEIAGGSVGNVALYAEWRANTISVRFKPDGGVLDGATEANGDEIKQFTFDQPYGTLPTPEKTDAKFLGWWTINVSGQIDVNSVQVFGYDIVDKDADFTLKAKWGTADTHAVTFNANGTGATVMGGSTYALTVDHNSHISDVKGMTAVRPGYVLLGWTLTPSSSDVAYIASSSALVTANITVYAQWRARTYTVTLDPGAGASVSQTSLTLNYSDSGKYGPLPTPVKSGYKLIGWYAEPAFTNRVYATTAAFHNGELVYSTLYAKMVESDAIVVTLDAGTGATVSTGSVTATFGQKYTNVNNIIPTKAGYTFGGWFTGENGTGTMVINANGALTEATVTNGEDHSIYAKWTIKSYTVTLDAKGGTVTPATVSVNYGAASYGILPTPVREGYTFVDWYRDESFTLAATAPAFNAAGEIESAYATLYAKWTAVTYTVTYVDPGDGAATGTYTKDSETITLQRPSKTGYNFIDWHDGSASGTVVTQIAAGSTGNKVFYAEWSAKQLTLTFAGASGTVTGSTGNEKATVGQKYVALDGVSATRDGYTFAGWYLGNELITKDSTVAPADSAITLTAHWTKITYTITVYAAGGSGYSSIPATYDAETATITLPTAADMTKTGYTFTAWHKGSASGTAVAQIATGSYGDIALYAEWSAVNVAVTLDGASKGNVRYDSLYSGMTEPTKVGYTFAGYKYAGGSVTDMSTAVNTANGVVKTGNSYTLTLTSDWTAVDVAVTLDGASKGNVKYGSTYSGMTAPVKTGYTFAGYSYSGGSVTDMSTLITTDNGVVNSGNSYTLTLTSDWNVVTYIITYVLNGGVGDSYGIYTVETETFALPAATKAGYTLAWRENNASGAVVTQIVKGTTGNKTYYADWTKETYNITVQPNGGNGHSSIPATYDVETATITLPTAMTKTNYTFVAWHKGTVSGEVVTSIPTGSTGDITLVAEWRAVEYAITVDYDGGVNTGTAIPATYNVETSAITLPTATDMSKPGYTFKQWHKGSASGTVVTQIATGSTGDIALYAEWEANVISVTLTLATGESCSPTSLNVTVGEPFGTLPVLTKTGYDGVWQYNGADIDATTVVPAVDAIELTARWTAKTYEIALSAGTGATVAPAAVTVTYGGKYGGTYGALPVPTKPGSTFDGWYTDSGCTDGNKVTAASDVAFDVGTDDLTYDTLYAKWIATVYHAVTLNYNDGGVTESETMTVKNGDKAYAVLIQPTRTGYVFAGWYNGSTLVTAAPTITADVTFVAKWIELDNKSLVVKFSDGFVKFTVTGEDKVHWGTAEFSENFLYAFDTVGGDVEQVKDEQLGAWQTAAMNGQYLDMSSYSASSIEYVVVSYNFVQNITTNTQTRQTHNISVAATTAGSIEGGKAYVVEFTGWCNENDDHIIISIDTGTAIALV